MNQFLSIFVAIIGLISISTDIHAQSENWNYRGTLFASYGNPNGYRDEPSVLAELYSSFDGETVIYKLIVGGEVYTASRNPNFSQSQYDNYIRRSQDDHFHGPHLKNCERYPYVAGKYRFNPAHAHK